MLYMTDVLTDDQIDPYAPSGGGDTSTAQTGSTSGGTSTRQGITSAPSGPATTDPSGSGVTFPLTVTDSASASPTSGGGAVPSDTASGGGNTHVPGEIWTLGPGQGCAPGYAAQQTADGRWTCIPMSDFNKIFSGDFSPLFAGNAPKGVAPVDTASSVYVGGQYKGTAMEAAVANGYVPSGTSGTAGATTQGPTGGSGAGLAAGGDTVNRLIDLVAGMYAGAGVKGGGSGFGGLVSGPISSAPENTGELATPAPKKSPLGAIFIVLVLAAGGWYYYKHRKGSK